MQEQAFLSCPTPPPIKGAIMAMNSGLLFLWGSLLAWTGLFAPGILVREAGRGRERTRAQGSRQTGDERRD